MLYVSIISVPEELNQQQVRKYVVNNIRCLNSKPIHVTGSGLQPPHRLLYAVQPNFATLLTCTVYLSIDLSSSVV
jgi:hypothetical protein